MSALPLRMQGLRRKRQISTNKGPDRWGFFLGSIHRVDTGTPIAGDREGKAETSTAISVQGRRGLAHAVQSVVMTDDLDPPRPPDLRAAARRSSRNQTSKENNDGYEKIQRQRDQARRSRRWGASGKNHQRL